MSTKHEESRTGVVRTWTPVHNDVATLIARATTDEVTVGRTK